MENIEIEVRITIKNPQNFIQWLKKSAKQMKTFYQEDYYLQLPENPFICNFKGYKDANEWLRVRMSSKDSICYKKWHRDEKTGKSLYADELEINVENGSKTLELLKKLGFEIIETIKKYREEWQYKNFLICYDKVEELGEFFEIEFIGEIDNPAKGKQKIFDFIKKIGIKNWQTIERGYPWMKWNQGMHKKSFERTE